jgi:hypothetical protein
LISALGSPRWTYSFELDSSFLPVPSVPGVRTVSAVVRRPWVKGRIVGLANLGGAWSPRHVHEGADDVLRGRAVYRLDGGGGPENWFS